MDAQFTKTNFMMHEYLHSVPKINSA